MKNAGGQQHREVHYISQCLPQILMVANRRIRLCALRERRERDRIRIHLVVNDRQTEEGKKRLTKLGSAKHVIMPNFNVDFWPALQPARHQMDVCVVRNGDNKQLTNWVSPLRHNSILWFINLCLPMHNAFHTPPRGTENNTPPLCLRGIWRFLFLFTKTKETHIFREPNKHIIINQIFLTCKTWTPTQTLIPQLIHR